MDHHDHDHDDTDVIERLRALAPSMPTPPGAFDQVEARVRHRRRSLAAGTALGVAFALAIPLTLAVREPEQTSGRDIAPANPGQGPSGEAPTVTPGGERSTAIGAAVDVTDTGTATVELGRVPSAADGVSIAFWCLSPGRFEHPGGSTTCDFADVNRTRSRSVPLQQQLVVGLEPGQTSFRVEASEGASWRVVATYVSTTRTEWGVNDSGETYGVENENGSPDLVRVYADNGRVGYAYAEELNNPSGLPEPQTPEEALEYTEAVRGKSFQTPVYESDGQTQIGVFTTGGSR